MRTAPNIHSPCATSHTFEHRLSLSRYCSSLYTSASNTGYIATDMVAMTMKSANSLDDTKLLNYQNTGIRLFLSKKGHVVR